ncbi:ATP-dependent nuclease [Pseudomonas oryzihabitans]|uniref:ATP-dependent nuclease n=1 Tax=Pseudomonas oryzihabitans TaxID=47885 RepID=UPI003CEBD9B7
MEISKVILNGFRNYKSATINFSKKSLIIGSNDCGKTNLIHSLRLLLDKSLSENDLEPCETDFNIDPKEGQSDRLSIEIHFTNVVEDAVLSILKGNVSSESKTILKYEANRIDLSYTLKCGPSQDYLTEITSRFYLKYINLKYVKSTRDLEKFVSSEKRHLLRLAQESRSAEEIDLDQKQQLKIEKSLDAINKRVAKLNYVSNATSAVNNELQKLSYDLTNYNIQLDSGAIQTQQFIDNLKLTASTSGSKISLGGDGRNNQILMALWKAKSQREYDPESEVIFYCIEEPEAHLHPHQQRKLADYLLQDLPGQTFITTHSPQITARYSPDSIINIICSERGSYAASDGCSHCIEKEWINFGYRMSVLPAEAFFSKCVLLVEGPSELLLYHELARRLDVDLDYYNISILSVDGIQFKVYTRVLNAMEIPWVVRTDNDIFKIEVESVEKRNLAGLNRCLELARLPKLPHMDRETTHQTLVDLLIFPQTCEKINPLGIYIAHRDLETDLCLELPDELKTFCSTTDLNAAVTFLQEKKAIRMRQFIEAHGESLTKARNGDIAKPLYHCIVKASGL